MKEKAARILAVHTSHVAAGIRRTATPRGLSAAKRKAADTCAGYLLGHKGMMRHGHKLARALPIAGGVIEGTCRHIVANRMEITGARWGLTEEEVVLGLRAIRLNGVFKDY